MTGRKAETACHAFSFFLSAIFCVPFDIPAVLRYNILR